MEPTLLRKLSPDILLLIMKSVPDFGTLNSLVRSSKPFRHLLGVNEYGICGEISKRQFGPLWDDACQLLLFQRELKRDSETEWDIRKLFDPTNGGGEYVGIGILSGGTKVGIAESVELLKYAKKINLGEGKYTPQARETGGYVYSYAPADVMRTDRALLRLWLLLLACGPDWVEERAVLSYCDRKILPLDHLIDSGGVVGAYRWRDARAFLRFSLGELEDMYAVSNAAWYIWSESPGTIKQGAHYWEVWGLWDNLGVQLKANMYLRNKIMECRKTLAQTR